MNKLLLVNSAYLVTMCKTVYHQANPNKHQCVTLAHKLLRCWAAIPIRHLLLQKLSLSLETILPHLLSSNTLQFGFYSQCGFLHNA